MSFASSAVFSYITYSGLLLFGVWLFAMDFTITSKTKIKTKKREK